VKKQTLRLNFKKKRSAFSDGKVQDLSIDIANQVLKLNIWDYNNFHVFFPIEKNNEINTKLIIQVIQGKDKNVILPKLNLENKSSHVLPINLPSLIVR